MRKAQSLLADRFRLGSSAAATATSNGSANLNGSKKLPAETAANLLASGLDLNAAELATTAPLQRAAAEGHVDIVHQLVKHGADVNHQDSVHGNSALHEAAWRGYSQTATLLCRQRANVDAVNRAGFTALHLCCQNGHNETCRVLLTANANPDAKNHYGDTPLHTSARYGHAGVMRILISAKCHVAEQNKNGDTALHIAAAMGRRKLTRILLAAGCPTTIKNKQGETPVDIAQRKEFREILSMLQNPPAAAAARPSDSRRRSKSKSRSSKRDKSQPAPSREEPSTSQSKDRRKRKETDGVAGAKHGHLWSPYGCHETPDIAAVVHPKKAPTEPLKKGEQYYVDLAGNIRKGPVGVQVCYCGPLLHRLECRLDKDKLDILNRLDSSHARIDARITGLERRTQQQIQGLQRVVDSLGLESTEAGMQRLRNSIVLGESGQVTPELPVLDLANSTTSRSHSRVGSSDVSVPRPSDLKSGRVPSTDPGTSPNEVQYTLDKLGLDSGGKVVTNGDLSTLRGHLALERMREQRELNAIVEHYERRSHQNLKAEKQEESHSEEEEESDDEPERKTFPSTVLTGHDNTLMLSDARYETYDYPPPIAKPFAADTTTNSHPINGIVLPVEVSYRNLPLPRYHYDEGATARTTLGIHYPEIDNDRHNDSGYSTRPGESSHGPSPSLSGPADSFEADPMQSPRMLRRGDPFAGGFTRDLTVTLPPVLNVKKPWFPASLPQPPRVRFTVPQGHQEKDPAELFPPGTISSSSLV